MKTLATKIFYFAQYYKGMGIAWATAHHLPKYLIKPSLKDIPYARRPSTKELILGSHKPFAEL
jgi:hypothetical protein